MDLQTNTPLRIGLAGIGTVGASLARLIQRHGNELAVRCGRSVAITGVSARDRKKDRGVDLSRAVWHDDPVTLARDPGNDVFVELIGGADGPALAAVQAAVDAGKHVVTANKALLAAHGVELARQAETPVSASISRRRRPAASRSSRRSARRSRATPSAASTASSTAPATTSSRAWSRRTSPSRSASRRRSGSATPRPIRLSTSAATIRHTSSPC